MNRLPYINIHTSTGVRVCITIIIMHTYMTAMYLCVCVFSNQAKNRRDRKRNFLRDGSAIIIFFFFDFSHIPSLDSASKIININGRKTLVISARTRSPGRENVSKIKRIFILSAKKLPGIRNRSGIIRWSSAKKIICIWHIYFFDVSRWLVFS